MASTSRFYSAPISGFMSVDFYIVRLTKSSPDVQNFARNPATRHYIEKAANFFSRLDGTPYNLDNWEKNVATFHQQYFETLGPMAKTIFFMVNNLMVVHMALYDMFVQ